ncbi:Aste57867_4088 [Aphanomyces stellatus]|uniref:Aste57867_4088 protein n=1 Tax=Aphanomyces stellatus TaxID=120398 RepID=A0A485KDC0_9STRA|nr:hypothetical protein As57867_004077 [Aphanomyces stellatus]VFT81221.1 Aste57867_4088 [Aphanomyces stellatus]
MSSSMEESKIVQLEHINLSIQEGGESKSTTGSFYLGVLGCARDPRLEWMIHANIGLSQFHILPNQPANQRINGELALFYTNLDTFAKHMQGQSYDSFVDVRGDVPVPESIHHWEFTRATRLYRHLRITGPHGNTFVAFESPADYVALAQASGAHPGERSLGDGLAYIKFLVRRGTAAGIARFYQQLLGASSIVESTNDDGGACASVACGPMQRLLFEETAAALRPYDGHHICIYIRDFEASYQRIHAKGLAWNNPLFHDRCDTWVETQKHKQFRVLHIVDPDTDDQLLELEHEVRPLDHARCPLFQS